MKSLMFLFISTSLFCFGIPKSEAKSKSRPKTPQPVQNETYPKKATINAEKGVRLSLVSEKGYTWKTVDECEKEDKPSEKCKGAKVVASPDNESSVEILGKKEKVSVEDPFSPGEKITQEYYHVRIIYDRLDPETGKWQHVDEVGWLESGFVRPKENVNQPLPVEIPKKSPPQQTKKTCGPSLVNEDIIDTGKVIDVTAFDLQVDALMEKVGTCIKQNPKNADQRYKVNYERYVLPVMQNQEVPPLTKIVGGQTMLMDQKDLINIDTLARTLYGEVASCFDKGLQHPIAVTEVALNRYNAMLPIPDDKESKKQARDFKQKFLPTKGRAPGMPLITELLTDPKQFNNWMTYKTVKNKKTKKKVLVPNPALKQTLCPPVEEYKKIKQGKQKYMSYNLNAWQNAVRIATEAVLNKRKFDERTSEVPDSITYFTSYRKEFHGFEQGYPEIEGNSLDEDGCVQVWHDPVLLKKEQQKSQTAKLETPPSS